MSRSTPPPNPRRVAAGRLNRRKRGPLTPEGRERLRQAALANRPWEHATGPRTAEGKARAAANGKVRQKGECSVREVRALFGGLDDLLTGMAAARQVALKGRA